VNECALADHPIAAEPEDARAGTGGRAGGGVIIGVEDESVVVRLGGEDTLLGGDVILKAAVAVEVIGRDVEDDGDAGAEALGGLQLEA